MGAGDNHVVVDALLSPRSWDAADMVAAVSGEHEPEQCPNDRVHYREMSGAPEVALHCAHASAAGRYGDEATLLPRVWKEWSRSRLDPGNGFFLTLAGTPSPAWCPSESRIQT